MLLKIKFFILSTIFLVYLNVLSNEWNKTFIDTTNNYGKLIDLDIDTMGYPHIAYGNLIYARWNGTDWLYEKVTDSVGKSNLEDPLFALDQKGYPHFLISESPDTNIRTLEYFYKDYSGWNQKADSFSDSSGYTIYSLDVDSSGYLHLLMDRMKQRALFDGCCELILIRDFLEYRFFDGENWILKWSTLFSYSEEACGGCDDNRFVVSGSRPAYGSILLNSKDSAYIIYVLRDYTGYDWYYSSKKLCFVSPNTTYSLIEKMSLSGINLRLSPYDIPYVSYYAPADSQLYLVERAGIPHNYNWITDQIELYGEASHLKFCISPDNIPYFLYDSDSLLKLSWRENNGICKYCIIDTIPSINSSYFSIDNEGRFHAAILARTGNYKTVYYYTADSILNADSIIPQPDTLPDIITNFSFNISPLITNQYIDIQYEIPSTSEIFYKIYDSMGRIVKNIVEEKDAGSFSLRIDLGNNPAGIYFINIETGTYRENKKILLLK